MNMTNREIYPLTIVADRYTGAYSGGEYTAWNLFQFQIPKDIFADDVTCMMFWENASAVCGKGRNAMEAEAALKEMKKNG